jgi:hypothetical protein
VATESEPRGVEHRLIKNQTLWKASKFEPRSPPSPVRSPGRFTTGLTVTGEASPAGYGHAANKHPQGGTGRVGVGDPLSLRKARLRELPRDSLRSATHTGIGAVVRRAPAEHDSSDGIRPSADTSGRLQVRKGYRRETRGGRREKTCPSHRYPYAEVLGTSAGSIRRLSLPTRMLPTPRTSDTR